MRKDLKSGRKTLLILRSSAEMKYPRWLKLKKSNGRVKRKMQSNNPKKKKKRKKRKRQRVLDYYK